MGPQGDQINVGAAKIWMATLAKGAESARPSYRLFFGIAAISMVYKNLKPGAC